MAEPLPRVHRDIGFGVLLDQHGSWTARLGSRVLEMWCCCNCDRRRDDDEPLFCAHQLPRLDARLRVVGYPRIRE